MLVFFHDTPTPEIYTLSLHDALPISEDRIARRARRHARAVRRPERRCGRARLHEQGVDVRSEEHTSELQSQFHLVCRLLLEKKKTKPRADARRSRSVDSSARPVKTTF